MEHRPKVVGDFVFSRRFLVLCHCRATSHRTCDAIHTLVEGEPNLGTVGAMMPLNLIWLVHGGFWVK
jgi:hypothetical protein